MSEISGAWKTMISLQQIGLWDVFSVTVWDKHSPGAETITDITTVFYSVCKIYSALLIWKDMEI